MARKKKEIAPGVTKKTPKVDNLIITEIVNVAHNRNRKDVGTLKSAIERAESVTIPNRYRLYDLYHDVVTIDGHLSGLLDKRTKSVTNKGLTFHDNSGKKVDELDSLINSPQFERFVEICMETLYWGTSAIEFIVGPNFSFEEIDRRHIRPEAREIATNMFDSKGISIDNLPQVMILGKKNDLGKLLQCSMYALYKRSGFGDFAQYVEIFGQPVRVVKYDAYDSETQKKLRQTLEESGSSLTIMIPKQADFEMLDGKTSNGNGELQKSLIEVCNQEMSIAILGNSETTTSSNSSGYAQAAVHQSQQLEITQSDLRYICNILNSEQFLNILTSYGYNVQGGSFCFDEEIDLQKLKSRLDIDIQLSNKVPISDDYWYETYGIPKPDNYDQLKQEQEERRQAVLEAIKSGEKDNDKGNTQNEPKDKENDPKKKSKLFDHLADFFGFAP